MMQSDIEDEISDICKKYSADNEVLIEQDVAEIDGAVLYNFEITLTVYNFKSMSTDRAFGLVKDMENITISMHEHKDAYHSKKLTVYDSNGKECKYEKQKSGDSYFEYVMCDGHLLRQKMEKL